MFLSDFLQLFVYFRTRCICSFGCFHRWLLCSAGTNAKRGWTLAFCSENRTGPIWSGGSAGSDVCAGRTYVTDTFGSVVGSVCTVGFRVDQTEGEARG